MPFEYSVVPAPKKGQKAKGVKSAEDRFAYALQQIMNEKGAGGWEYVRTDTLPSEERQGLTGSKTVYQNMMVFRREVVAEAAPAEPPRALLAAPVPEAEREETVPEMAPEPTFTRSDGRTIETEPDVLEGDDARRPEPPLRAD